MSTAVPVPHLHHNPPGKANRRHSSQFPSAGYIRERRLLDFMPFSRSTLWRRVADESFPAPVKIFERVTAWRVEDVRAWMDKQQ